MNRLIAACVAIAFLPGLAWAQAFPPNEAGVTMGHWHLNTRDVEANKRIFAAMGGAPIKAGNFEVVLFPGVAVYLHAAPGTAPPAGGTVGTVVNHVGFLVQNVQDSIARWKAAGIPVVPGNNRTDQAFVTTPDAVRIEILEDRNQKMPIQHHHVHFNVPESAIPEMQAWYARMFGATPGMRGQNKAGDLPGANLTYSATPAATVTTKGRALDHIGFDVRNLAAFMKKLEAAGVKIDRPYTKNAQTGAALAFIYDPWGTYIELNERPTPLVAGNAAAAQRPTALSPTRDIKVISSAGARAMADACTAWAEQNKQVLAMAIIDWAGNLVEFHAMEGAPANAIETAQLKAKSALRWRRPTSETNRIVRTGENLAATFMDDFPQPGALPIMVDGQIVGAMGVSGADGEKCAQAAIDAVFTRRPS